MATQTVTEQTLLVLAEVYFSTVQQEETEQLTAENKDLDFRAAAQVDNLDSLEEAQIAQQQERTKLMALRVILVTPIIPVILAATAEITMDKMRQAADGQLSYVNLCKNTLK